MKIIEKLIKGLLIGLVTTVLFFFTNGLLDFMALELGGWRLDYFSGFFSGTLVGWVISFFFTD